MKKSSYMNRAMRARDPRFAQVLSRLGYERADMVADDAPPVHKPHADKINPAQQGHPDRMPGKGDDMVALRKQYQAVLGKKPFAGWDAETLKTKIAAAKA